MINERVFNVYRNTLRGIKCICKRESILYIDEYRYKMYNLNIDNYQCMRWDYEN